MLAKILFNIVLEIMFPVLTNPFKITKPGNKTPGFIIFINRFYF